MGVRSVLIQKQPHPCCRGSIGQRASPSLRTKGHVESIDPMRVYVLEEGASLVGLSGDRP
eukprot:8555602-Prorocentrum_lima.AAC.1